MASTFEENRLNTIANAINKANTVSLISLNLTAINTEYSVTLTNIKNLSFKIISGGSIRYAYEPGKVATPTLPYYPLEINTEENEDFGLSAFTGTLYLASSTANTIVVVKTWS